MNSFSKLSWQERLAYIQKKCKLTHEEINLLQNNICTDLSYADNLIENAIGYFPLALGCIPNFTLNERVYTIPIATEESSVIAGLINANLYIKRHKGHITTTKLSNDKIGQIQIPVVSDINRLKLYLSSNKNSLILAANNGPARNMFNRNGGVYDISLREITRPDGKIMGVIHVIVNTADAMGANTINQVCEFLKNTLAVDTEENYNIAILSNLNEDLVQAEIVVPNVSEELGTRMEESSLFAHLDMYRASTNNKGIMNAIDGLLIATGNDFRGVEAAMHAYAARNSYTSLSTWKYQNNTLYGTLQAPISVGVVGGAIATHPLAQLCLQILGVKTSSELAQVCAAIGLAQNFAALKALCTDGIVRGHMNLHLKNFVSQNNLNVSPEDRDAKIKSLRAKLKQRGFITASDA